MTTESVADLRKRLVDIGMTEQQASEIKGKEQLRTNIAVLECDKKVDDLSDAIENSSLLDIIDDKALEEQIENADPEIGAPGWNKFIMSKFREDELKEGKYPAIWGLRRVVNEYVGEIYKNESKISFMSEINGVLVATATCNIEIVFDSGDSKSYSDVADCHKYNTPTPYSLHASSTAATKAESRTLKKILYIRGMTAEEATEGEEEPVPTEVTDTQFQAINFICKNLDIDVVRLLSSIADDQITSISQVNYSMAAEAMATLNNKYQGSPESIPANISGYKAEWKENL